MDYKEKGVSLIELLITVSIMSILLAVGFWGYKGKGEELAFERAIIEITSNIEDTREMALSAKKTSGGDRPEGGYGVYFKKGQSFYIIFADNNKSKIYESGEEEKTISLENVNITSTSPPRPDNAVDIVFIPPSPLIYVNNSSTSIAQITFSGAGRTKKIIINQAGVISTE